jgi:multiple antibiotic resistance protein
MMTQEMSKEDRRRAAFKVITAVAVILFGSALVGKVLLDAIGIHLGAFGFVGGLIVGAMGLEMMSMGEPSRVQGGHASREEPNPEDQLLVPFAMPFIAGPGAITIVITLAARTETMDATYMALAAVGVAVLAMSISFTFLTDHLARIPERTMSVITKFGGLIIATIGAQLALNGIKMFFELG